MEKGSKSQLFIWIAQAAGARIVTRGGWGFCCARARRPVYTLVPLRLFAGAKGMSHCVAGMVARTRLAHGPFKKKKKHPRQCKFLAVTKSRLWRRGTAAAGVKRQKGRESALSNPEIAPDSELHLRYGCIARVLGTRSYLGESRAQLRSSGTVPHIYIHMTEDEVTQYNPCERNQKSKKKMEKD